MAENKPEEPIYPLPRLKGMLWSPEENAVIQKMVEEGASMDEIATTLLGRMFRAVEHQVRRLGLRQEKAVCVGEKIFFHRNSGGEIIQHEEALKVLAGAIERLQRGGAVWF